MANSKEIELVLSLNSSQAVTAIADIRAEAGRKSDAAIRDALEQHADNVGNLAAATIERAMQQSNKDLASLMVQNAGRAAEAMSRSLKAAYDDTLSDYERQEKPKGFHQQQAAFKNLDEKEVGEALTRGWLDMLKDGRTARATVTTFSETFTKALQSLDADDFIGIFKGAGGGVVDTIKGMGEKKKAQQLAAEAAGNAGEAAALGRAAAAMSTLAATMAFVVGGIALFAAWTKAADDAQKKLNTSLLEGAGASDFVSRSFDEQTGKSVNLTATLGDMRQAAYEVAKEFRFAEAEDATRILSELNQAGITYKEIAGSIDQAINRQAAFEDALRKTISRSRMLGVSTQEVATYQNTLMTELGYSLDTMGDVFGDISNAAERAGISTKTFFTTVSQATSGMALYSVRVSEAIGFLEGFAKALGEQDVGEFVKGLTKGPQGAQEAIRDIVVASKADPTALVPAFRDATGELIKDFGNKFKGQQGDLEAVFEQAGFSKETAAALFSKDKGEREAVAEMISGMTDEQRRQLMGGMGPEMAREFQKIAQLSQGIQPTIESQGAAYFASTPALRMEMLDKMTDFFGGTDKARSDVRVRAAFEQTTGKSGEELTQLFNVIDLVKGQVEAIERVSKGTATDSDKAALSEAGFTIKGKQVFRGDELVQSSADIYRTMDNLTDLTAKGESAQEKQAKEMYKKVNSIFNVLNLEIKQALLENNTILDDMFAADDSGAAEESRQRRKDAREAADARSKAAEEAEAKAEAARTAKAKSEGPHRTSEGKAAAEAEAKAAEEAAAAAAQKSYERAGAGMLKEMEGTLYGYNDLDIEPDPTSMASALNEFVTTGTPEAERLQQALTAYEEAYESTADPIGSLKYGSPGPLVSARADIIGLLNQMGESSGLQASARTLSGGGGIRIEKVNDGFFSDGVMYQTHPRDRALFYQDGGPMDPARMAGGGGVVININGGDQALVYRTVARAMRAAHR